MKQNYSIECRDFPVTQAIVEEVERCLQKITGRYDMQYMDVTLEKTPQGYKSTLACRQSDGSSFVVHGEHEDCYVSIGVARDRVIRKIRRSREKYRDVERHHSEGLGKTLAKAV